MIAEQLDAAKARATPPVKTVSEASGELTDAEAAFMAASRRCDEAMRRAREAQHRYESEIGVVFDLEAQLANHDQEGT